MDQRERLRVQRLLHGLPASDLLEVRAILDSLLRGGEPGNRLEVLCRYFIEATGRDPLRPGRDAAACWDRAIFCAVAREEGFTQAQIGHFLGMDHSSVCYMQGRIRTAQAAPVFYQSELTTLEQFKNYINEYDTETDK